MGRTDAVQFTLEWAAEARRLGAIVEFEPGFETRGNGTSANYEGGEVHHTAFLSSEGNPFPAKSTLKNGRTDLPGPLCNVAGPWCEDGAPRLVVIAAHPANHAGASGGKSMGPLPVTSLFNPRVFGLEIDYGGVVPMTKGQRKAATIFGRAVINVLRRNAEYVRAHAETSITGKWDPGYASGKTIDMGEFRLGITNFASTSEEDELMAAADDIAYIKGLLMWAFDPTLGTGPAFSQAGEITKAIGGLTYATFPEDGVNSAGEAVKRLRAIHGLVSDPSAFADAVAKRLPAPTSGGTGITRDDVKGAIRDVLGSLDAA